MSTIPDTMKTISRDIQHTFEELLKLLLRKSLRPTLNPLGTNTKIVYNTFRGRYERGFVGSSPGDNINKYSYIMTHDSLGWNGDVLANFKVLAKFIKNNTLQRFPVSSQCLQSIDFSNPERNAKKHNMHKKKSRVAFTDKETKNLNQPSYNNFLNFLTSKTMHNIIANRRASFSYTSDIPYVHTFKNLECIGRDIIDQTDPSISGQDSAKMSTSMLRVKLYNLEQNLANLSVDHPNIYESFIEMLRVINSVSRTKIVWVINLIAALTYQQWQDLPPNQQQSYVDILGSDFINAFNSNELITILLQSNSSEMVLTSSYLYPLMKMLFIVFGYSKIIPIISEKCPSKLQFISDRFRKHLERYRGASFRRGDVHDVAIMSEPYNNDNNNDNNDMEEYEISPFEKVRTNIPPENNYSDFFPMDKYKDKYKPEPEPVDQYIYEFIKLFGDLYPTLIGLMGGTEEFPPESIEIGCNDIPPNYDCLVSLPECFWRFNDYSYCRYLEYIGSKQLSKALCAKVNDKVKYLQSF